MRQGDVVFFIVGDHLATINQTDPRPHLKTLALAQPAHTLDRTEHMCYTGCT
jgi:hypothetical protein